MEEQLALKFRLRDDRTFASFYPASNVEALYAVKQTALGKNQEPYVYLWGEKDRGKSHLLQAACHACPETGIAAVYIPLENIDWMTPDVFMGLGELGLVCVDDLHHIAGRRPFEEAFFHLYNRIRQEGGRLLCAADSPANQLNITLQDLKSRLSWGLVYHLSPMDESDILQALKLRAFHRGLELSESVGKFLLKRCGPHLSSLVPMLEKLDKASLIEKRRLTIPFIKETLHI